MRVSLSQGLNSGFAGGEDESYNVYSEPWRKDQNVANSLYRPSKNADKDVYGDDLEALVKQKRWVYFVNSNIVNSWLTKYL